MTGYPIRSLPFGYLNLNGRPFGMVAMAAAHQEATLFKVMGAWHKTFNPVKPPPMILDGTIARLGENRQVNMKAGWIFHKSKTLPAAQSKSD